LQSDKRSAKHFNLEEKKTKKSKELFPKGFCEKAVQVMLKLTALS
jgi:hypothetical protein